MLKFLVIVWFLYSLITLFYAHPIMASMFKFMSKSYEGVDKHTDTKSLPQEQQFNILLSGVFCILYIVFGLLISILEFYVMLSLIKYDDTYIMLGYLIFSFGIMTIMFIKNLIKSKLSKSKTSTSETFLKQSEDMSKTTLYKFIRRLLDLLYYGYALYLLFI